MHKKRIGLIGASITLAFLALVVSLGWLYRPAQAEPQMGDISGTVAYYGGITDTADLIVAAHPDLGNPPVANAHVASPGGPFTLAGLANGDYYLSVFLDLSGGGGPPEPWEPQGFYDMEGDGQPDAITIADGDVSGIHVTLGGPWLPLGGPMMSGGQVNALAVHPTISGTVYAAVASPGAYDSGPSIIYKTTDGAASWTPVFVAENQVYALGVTDTVVYAGAFNPGDVGASIYASHDSGASWTTVLTATDRGVWLDVSVHPTDTNVAIIGGWFYHQVGPDRPQSGLVYRTEDAGLTWTPILTKTYPDAEASLNAVMIHPVTPTLLLASSRTWGGPNDQDSYILRSEDGGVTWPISTTAPDAHVVSFAANANQPAMLYAGAGFGAFSEGRAAVFRSTDAGLSWTEVHSEGTYLAFDPLHDRIYTIMDTGQVYVSSSDGDPGSWIGIGGIWDNAYALGLDLGPAPIAIYAGGWQEGVFKGVLDGGWTWETVNNGIETPAVPVDIDVDPTNPDKLFVAAECGAGWMTEDGGESWTEATGACAGAFAINPDDPDIVYLGEFNDRQGAVLRSDDGGMSFTPVYTAPFITSDGSGGDEAIFDLAIASSMTSTVYAVGNDNPNWSGGKAVVLRSLDDGVSWTVVFTHPQQYAHSLVKVVAIDPIDDDVVYVGGQGSDMFGIEGFVYRTVDGGDNWDEILTVSNTVSSLVINPQNPQIMYAADRGYQVWKSSDGGDSWTLVRQNPPDPSGYLLALDPHVPSHVYLGGYGYIAESVDGGLTWTEWDAPINRGTPGMEPRALAVDFGTVSQTLYAGFSGVWAHGRGAPQPGVPLTISMSITPTTPVYANGDNLLLYEGWVYDRYGNWVADGTPLSVTYGTEWTSPIVLAKETADGFFMGGWMNEANPGVVTFTAVAENGATGMVTGEFLYNSPLTLTVEAPAEVPVGETAVLSITAPGLHGGIASNGTVISLTTTLGQVNATALTVEGVATATVTSETGGVATVTLASGEVEVMVLLEFVGRDVYLPLVTRP